MNRIIAATLLATLFAAPVFAENQPAIGWGAAGKGEAAASEPLPEMNSAEKDTGGFDCKTTTRLSHDYRDLRPATHENLPSKVQRCSRDGFTLEMTSPAN